MKRGCLFAFLTWISVLLLSIVILLIDSAKINPEGLGDFANRVGLFLGFVVFVVVWIQRVNCKKRQPRQPTPSEGDAADRGNG